MDSLRTLLEIGPYSIREKGTLLTVRSSGGAVGIAIFLVAATLVAGGATVAGAALVYRSLNTTPFQLEEFLWSLIIALAASAFWTFSIAFLAPRTVWISHYPALRVRVHKWWLVRTGSALTRPVSIVHRVRRGRDDWRAVWLRDASGRRILLANFPDSEETKSAIHEVARVLDAQIE